MCCATAFLSSFSLFLVDRQESLADHQERLADNQERLVDNWESPVTSRRDWSVWREDFAGGQCRHEKWSGTPMGLLWFGGDSRLLSRGVSPQNRTSIAVRGDCWT